MDEKIVGRSFVPIPSMAAIRKGDYFRTAKGRNRGKLLTALEDAVMTPTPTAGHVTWQVRAKPVDLNDVERAQRELGLDQAQG